MALREGKAPRQLPLPLLLGPIVIAMAVAMVGDVIGPSLINGHPLWQIALNPRNRWLLLAAPLASAGPFFVVGFCRLVVIDPLFYVLGLQHGDAALRWAERKLADEAGLVRKVEGWFAKAAPGIVLVAPNGYVCLLAGASRMRVRTFVLLNVAGTVGRLLLFRLVGEAFRGQLLDVLEVIQRYQWWLVALSLLVVALQSRRRRAAGSIESVSAMRDEIEGQENAKDATARPDLSGAAGRGDAARS